MFCLQNTVIGESILQGIVKQEFRTVVICGSFRKHMDDVKKVVFFITIHNFLENSYQNLSYQSPLKQSFCYMPLHNQFHK
mgnify:CR=1 FL=1